MRRLAALATVALVLAACADPTSSRSRPRQSPKLRVAPPGQGVPGEYIVVLTDDVADVPGLAQRLANAHGGRLGFVYSDVLKGFSVHLSPAAAEALADSPA